ncbi:hypothetical protein [Amycolatopsis samaneae]|uniref:Uncharacterized protein n=1 Tax=Amycolatopsis samaneae TaxID=664691 RepID=A0ABW5GI63_9PSEU
MTTIVVPASMQPGSIEWRSVVERLAAFERRSVDEVAGRIQHLLTDVTRLRAADDLVIRGSIPLAAGVGLVSAAHKMLRAIATTALRPRAHIAGNFSRLGDQIVERARLGHTEEGSYVLPVLVPLTEETSEGPAHFWTEEGEVTRVAPEPPERRVTRTLAQALTAVETRIVQPARDPRPSDMHDLIAAGVSREFVLAVREVLDDPSVTTFEARFGWASGLTSPAAVPDTVPVPATATDLLTRTARLLSTAKRDSRGTFTGPIVEVRHLPNDPYGEVALQTIRRGRQVEIRVRLTEQQLDPAHEWMRTARTIVVEGPILRTPGRPLRVDQPESIYPLDESYLSPAKGLAE